MQTIKIDFDNPGLPQRLDVVENDAQSRFFKAVLYKDGKAYAAPSGATYSIMYRGFGPQNEGWYDTINDGAGKRSACSVSGNVVTCEIAHQALRVPGHVSVVLCVTGSNGYMLHGWPIDCNCRNDNYTGGTLVESFFYITQITNADWTSAIKTWEELKNMIDPTLSLSGKAADARATGNTIKTEKSRATSAEASLDSKKADKADLDIERKRIDVLNDGGLNLKDEVIDTSIKAWLDDHPEATTTVQDYSLDINKMIIGALDYVTPKMFGAEGNGVTDDTKSLQNMLDFAHKYGCGCLIASNKSYIFSHLHIPSNIIIIGCGGTLKLKDNTAIDTTVSYYPIECTNSENITIYNVNFDGNSANNSRFVVCDTITVDGNNVKIDHCTFIDAADSAIMLTGPNSSVTNSYIDGSTDVGIYINPYNIETTETKTLVDGVTIKNSKTSAIALKRNVKKTTITNCHISNSKFGITSEQVQPELGYTGEVIISNNWISSELRGIECRGNQHFTIIGNNITSEPAILIRGSDIIVNGNILNGNTNAISSFELEDIIFSNINISNNDITGTIKLNQSFIEKVTIANNTITGNIFMPLTKNNIACDNNLVGSIVANGNVVRIHSGNIIATEPVPMFTIGVTAASGNVEQFAGPIINAPSNAQLDNMTFQAGMFVFTHSVEHPLKYAKATGVGKDVLIDAIVIN